MSRLATWTGINSVLKKMKAMEVKAPSLTAQSMEYAAKAVLVPAIKKQIQANGQVFTGNYIKSIDAKGTVTREGALTQVGSFGVPYAEVLEKGGPAGRINMQKLVQYARQKNGAGSRAKSAAQSIARTLTTQGVKARPSIVPAYKANEGNFAKVAKVRIIHMVQKL